MPDFRMNTGQWSEEIPSGYLAAEGAFFDDPSSSVKNPENDGIPLILVWEDINSGEKLPRGFLETVEKIRTKISPFKILDSFRKRERENFVLEVLSKDQISRQEAAFLIKNRNLKDSAWFSLVDLWNENIRRKYILALLAFSTDPAVPKEIRSLLAISEWNQDHFDLLLGIHSFEFKRNLFVENAFDVGKIVESFLEKKAEIKTKLSEILKDVNESIIDNFILFAQIWLTELGDFTEIIEVLISAQPENLRMMIEDVWIREIQDFKKLESILARAQSENLRMLVEEVWVRNVRDFVDLEDVLIQANPENLKLITKKVWIKVMKDFLDLKNIFRLAKTENLKLIIEDAWIKTVNDLGDLEEYLISAKSENLKFLIRKGKLRQVSDFQKYTSVLRFVDLETLKANFDEIDKLV